MKKRIISALLVFVLLACFLPGAALAAGGLSNFKRVNTYKSGHFTDVTSVKWYAPYVQASYEYGLINGISPSSFEPDSTLTIAETIKMAACLNSIYNTGSAAFENGAPWYRTYADYALKNGIIAENYTDYNAPVTRSEFALILSKALPGDALSGKNSVDDNAIPDVPIGDSRSDAVYRLYRAGVLAGNDSAGTFRPNETLKRSEAAAVVTRMADVSFRQNLTLRLSLSTSQVFNKCAPAVFFIKLYDIKGTPIKSGSGFFIDASGRAVTNYHVISGSAKAVITTNDGKEYNVSGVYGYDKNKDLAIIQVDGSDFPYLSLGDSDKVMTGADAYAIGSPMGYKNTISSGIISSSSRDIDGEPFIQTTAAISSGSSGGALLDASGKVIGVTTMTAVGAQNINLAAPINNVKDLKTTPLVTLDSLLRKTVYYTNYYPVPDFGAYANVPEYQSETDGGFMNYYYSTSGMPMAVDKALDGYVSLLEENTFEFYGYTIEDGNIVSYYMNNAYGLLVTFGIKEINGQECIRIQITSL